MKLAYSSSNEISTKKLPGDPRGIYSLFKYQHDSAAAAFG